MSLDVEDCGSISVTDSRTQGGLGTVTLEGFYLFEALYAPYVLEMDILYPFWGQISRSGRAELHTDSGAGI